MKNVNVLLVEDNEINQIVAGAFLRKSGMMVTIAKHGKDAIAKIVGKNFQLVLMDLQMPEMDGYESTAIIRSMDDPYFKTIPILAFSASSLIESQEKAISCGMNDFVTKPLMPEDLQRKINKYVMNTSIHSSSNRPLKIDFELYTDNDPEFKQELIVLMIENLVELKQSLKIDHSVQDLDNYRKVGHKIKPTLSMLDDQEFTDVIDLLKDTSLAEEQRKNAATVLHKLTDAIIKSLEAEVK